MGNRQCLEFGWAEITWHLSRYSRCLVAEPQNTGGVKARGARRPLNDSDPCRSRLSVMPRDPSAWRGGGAGPLPVAITGREPEELAVVPGPRRLNGRACEVNAGRLPGFDDQKEEDAKAQALSGPTSAGSSPSLPERYRKAAQLLHGAFAGEAPTLVRTASAPPIPQPRRGRFESSALSQDASPGAHGLHRRGGAVRGHAKASASPLVRCQAGSRRPCATGGHGQLGPAPGPTVAAADPAAGDAWHRHTATLANAELPATAESRTKAAAAGEARDAPFRASGHATLATISRDLSYKT